MYRVVHIFMYCLCLVLNDAATSCSRASRFFLQVQKFYVFFSASTRRWDILKKHASSLTLKPLSTTR